MKEASKAHALLHYMISKAILEGKETKHEIKLKLSDLHNEVEDVGHNDPRLEIEANNIILTLKLETIWDTSEELIPEEEFLGEEENEQDGNDSTPNSDKKSH